MKTWVWVLLLVAVVLFLWTVRREGFLPTTTLKGPPYGDTDYTPIVKMMSPTLVAALKAKNNVGVAPVEPLASASAAAKDIYQTALTAYNKKLVDGIISDTMGEFYTKIYQPASTPMSTAKVDTFMFDYPGRIKATSPPAFMFLIDNKADVSALLVAYFVTQTQGAANGPLLGAGATSAQQAAAAAAASTASGYSTATGYAASLLDVGQGPGGTGATSAQQAAAAAAAASTASGYSTATGYAASLLDVGQGPGGTGATGPTGGTGGNTTGGSSTTQRSNSGTNKGNIFGPAFTGFGDNAGGGGGLGARDYPTLIGPVAKVSKYVEGAGIANLSQSETLAKSGALPSGAGTGSDANSRFFGSSRTPGDRDLIPDPNQVFTPSIGSSKTEPVPYLADFSAFTS
jgi:hypothetical protein